MEIDRFSSNQRETSRILNALWNELSPDEGGGRKTGTLPAPRSESLISGSVTGLGLRAGRSSSYGLRANEDWASGREKRGLRATGSRACGCQARTMKRIEAIEGFVSQGMLRAQKHPHSRPE
jgi:hypothetical protein